MYKINPTDQKGTSARLITEHISWRRFSELFKNWLDLRKIISHIEAEFLRDYGIKIIV